MKVRNVAFSGFAAAILATGVAHAATPTAQIASRAYVDRVDEKVTELNTTVETLNTNLTDNYTTTEDLGGVIDANIADALDSDNSAISQALADKEDSKNKVEKITDTNKDSTTEFPTVGAVTEYTKQEIDNALADGVAIEDGSITAEKLSDELNTKIDAAQNAGQVDAAIRAYTIPVPPTNCQATSGRCLLSVDTEGELAWVDVTEPAE